MLSAGVYEARKRSSVEENSMQRISLIRQQSTLLFFIRWISLRKCVSLLYLMNCVLWEK